jgi:hypothetical protein
MVYRVRVRHGGKIAMFETDLNEFFKHALNFWDGLTEGEKQSVIENTMTLHLKKGSTIYHYAGHGSRGIHIIM